MGGPVVMKGRRTPCKISLLFVPASHFNQEFDLIISINFLLNWLVKLQFTITEGRLAW